MNAHVTDPDRAHLRRAIDLAEQCPPSRTAFSVGAVIIGGDGILLVTGRSRETDPRDHAEEAALAKFPAGDARLRGATLYSSLEPCSTRASRPRPPSFAGVDDTPSVISVQMGRGAPDQAECDFLKIVV